MVGIVIQARMGSTRLPEKVLLDICGKTMLERVVERSSRAEKADITVVATTVSPGDDRLAEFCGARGIPVFRGSSEDVLDRYYRTAREFGIDPVVRITSDCPLMDPGVVDLVVGRFLESEGGCDYCTNVLNLEERTFPRGLDVEVIDFGTLERLALEIDESRMSPGSFHPDYREHVTFYIRENPGLFRVVSVRNETDYSQYRWTVDTPEDLEFVRAVYSALGVDGGFTWLDVVDFLERNPELSRRDDSSVQKTMKGKVW